MHMCILYFIVTAHVLLLINKHSPCTTLFKVYTRHVFVGQCLAFGYVSLSVDEVCCHYYTGIFKEVKSQSTLNY